MADEVDDRKTEEEVAVSFLSLSSLRLGFFFALVLPRVTKSSATGGWRKKERERERERAVDGPVHTRERASEPAFRIGAKQKNKWSRKGRRGLFTFF